MYIKIPIFKGIVPLADYRILAPEIATEAVNCRFERGNLESYNNYSIDGASLRSNTQSIYLYNDVHWFSWETNVDTVLSPVINDNLDTVIFTGQPPYPRIGYNTTVLGANPPVNSYQLGVPVPADPPLISNVLNNNQDADGEDNDETRFYCYTYVTGNGEESVQSPISAEQTILTPNAVVELTIPSLVINNANVTDVRIYRTGTTLETADFYLVKEIPVNQTVVNDNLITLSGVTLTSQEHYPPHEDMQGLTLLPTGIGVGFFDKNICFSEPYLIYAWSNKYRQTTEENIVGIAVSGNSVVVGTQGNPYIFSGISPDSMTGQKIELKQACSSKRSMVDMGDVVIYASPDGLVAVSESSANLITEQIIRRDQWQAKYKPETIHACHFEGKYIGFYNNSDGFIYDPTTQTLVDLDFYATATYNDLKHDKLYLVISDQLCVWDDDATYLPKRWKKTFDLNGMTLPTCIRIESHDITNVHFTLYVDDVIVAGMDRDLSEEVFWLPPLRGDTFSIEISGTADVRGITMADSKRDLHNG